MCSAGRPRNDKGDAGSHDLRAALRLYTLGFAVLGGGVGFYAGSSQSPVISTLLPLLFGLTGGAGGLYLAKADLTKPETNLRLRTLGKCILLFIIVALVGSAYGISLRTGRSMLNFVSPRLVLPERPVFTHIPGSLSVDIGMESVILRARLKALGAADTEIQAILEGVWADADAQSRSPASASLRQLAALADVARTQLGSALRSEPQVEEPRQSLHELMMYLAAYSEDYRQWAERIKGGDVLPTAFVNARIDGLLRILHDLLYGYGGCALWLAQHSSARQAVWELEWNLIQERHGLDRRITRPYREQSEAADRLISVIYGGGGGTPSPSPPWELPEVAHEE